MTDLDELPKAETITPEEWLDRETGMPSFSVASFMERSMQRAQHIRDRGFVRLTVEVVEVLAKLLEGKKVIEVGSGPGFLAMHLENRGVNILAVDRDEESFGFHAIRKRDIVADGPWVVEKCHDVVLMCWPTMGTNFAWRTAMAMTSGQTLIYEGAWLGGCTASDEFFEEMDSPRWVLDQEQTDRLNEYHRRFEDMHDWWYVYKRE